MNFAQNRPENRRKHVVYVTHNTEYHCRGDECVGVRDRKSGRWTRIHAALRAHLLGGVNRFSQVVPSPKVGLRLVFQGSEPVVTSEVIFASRPEKEVLPHYVSLCRSGIISAA